MINLSLINLIELLESIFLMNFLRVTTEYTQEIML